MYDRITIEQIALDTISADNYYELADNIKELKDSELWDIIEANGNYKKEMKLMGVTK